MLAQWFINSFTAEHFIVWQSIQSYLCKTYLSASASDPRSFGPEKITASNEAS